MTARPALRFDAGAGRSSFRAGSHLFDDSQVTLIERGQPRQHHVLSADYTAGKWNANLRANYYGEVQGQGFTAPFPQLGFTYCWETCPFGINGRSWYARLDVNL